MLILLSFLFAGPDRSKNNDCIRIAAEIEKQYNIPKNLLVAMMKVESGYNPYAVYGRGRGYRCQSKEEALRVVNRLAQAGYRNINVGNMQINLQFHRNVYKTLEAFFNPYNNISYAARFLVDLKNKFGSWKKAVSYYHSGNNYLLYRNYIKRVNKNLTYNINLI